MCSSVIRICRTLAIEEEPSHLLLVALPCSGRKIIVKIAMYVLNGLLFKVSNEYDRRTWSDEIKFAMKECFRKKVVSAVAI